MYVKQPMKKMGKRDVDSYETTYMYLFCEKLGTDYTLQKLC